MTQNVKISVIIPVYNAADFLSRAVGSVLMQEFDDFEVILVDDGSTDGSAAICDEFAAHDERVRVIHKENGGVSSARNAGLDAAHGEFVMFVDADDAIKDDSLVNMYSFNSDFVLAGFEKVQDAKLSESYVPSKTASYHGTGEICMFFDKVLPAKNTYILNKYTFGTYELPNSIAGLVGIDEIEVVGLCTDICVVSNALLLKAMFYNTHEISVDATCCAGVTPESHEAALKTMEMCQINVKR
jgi:glycosyltransferase involved in cell wall biosynthesis